MEKSSPANAGDIRDSFNPWAGKIPFQSSRRAGQPTPVFSLGESQRSLEGYSPEGHKARFRNQSISPLSRDAKCDFW